MPKGDMYPPSGTLTNPSKTKDEPAQSKFACNVDPSGFEIKDIT